MLSTASFEDLLSFKQGLGDLPFKLEFYPEFIQSVNNVGSDYYNFIIDSNIISISNFLSKLTTKYNIEDIEIDNESIDDVILKLYEDYEL